MYGTSGDDIDAASPSIHNAAILPVGPWHYTVMQISLAVYG